MSTQLLAPAHPRESHLSPDSCKLAGLNRGVRMWRTALTKTAAEELLDWLENHGHGNCQVSCVVDEGFTVMDPQ